MRKGRNDGEAWSLCLLMEISLTVNNNILHIIIHNVNQDINFMAMLINFIDVSSQIFILYPIIWVTIHDILCYTSARLIINIQEG